MVTILDVAQKIKIRSIYYCWTLNFRILICFVVGFHHSQHHLLFHHSRTSRKLPERHSLLIEQFHLRTRYPIGYPRGRGHLHEGDCGGSVSCGNQRRGGYPGRLDREDVVWERSDEVGRSNNQWCAGVNMKYRKQLLQKPMLIDYNTNTQNFFTYTNHMIILLVFPFLYPNNTWYKGINTNIYKRRSNI